MSDSYAIEILGIGVCKGPEIWSNERLINKFQEFWYKINDQGEREQLRSSDRAIKRITGIGQRHFAPEGTENIDMAVVAATDALFESQVPRNQIGIVAYTTNTHPNNYEYPSLGCQLQGRLSIGTPPEVATYLEDVAHCEAWDHQAGCTGGIYTVVQTVRAIRASRLRDEIPINYVLAGASEKLSDMLNFADRDTCVLLGDASGFYVIGITEYDGPPELKPGIRATYLNAVGDEKTSILHSKRMEGINLKGEKETKNYFLMDKQTVKDFGVPKGAEVCRILCDRMGLSLDDITFFNSHSANRGQIIDEIAKELGVSKKKFYSTIETDSNTSAASTLLNRHAMREEGLLKPGDIILHLAFGAGLTYGGFIEIISERTASPRSRHSRALLDPSRLTGLLQRLPGHFSQSEHSQD
ncbi:MAG: ketoacyl-ACP synthase III [Nanoarchaeota archaeon]|nr:ketoacyl-ACP synthase III [Nanoarchaeota archaeon]